VVFVVFLAGCSTAPPLTPEDPPDAPVIPEGVDDQRGRFGEIFCAILDERGHDVPDTRPCDEALTLTGTESEGTGGTVELGPSKRPLAALVVPGIGWDCFANWLDLQGSVTTHVRQFGYDLAAVDVQSLSSSATNARVIRDAVMATEGSDGHPDLVLVGYSKGTPDILEAVVAYPEIRPRIAAVVSVAGAVGGSPIADEVTQSQLELLRNWPGAECSKGDAGALESLRPAIRDAWLDENPLPDEITYYSLVTVPTPGRVSSALKPFYKKLGKIEHFNDGMVMYSDQFVPGSTLLGYVNADHWTVAVPIARTHFAVGTTVVNRNDYPREALLEAVLRFVEEDLATRER